VLASKSKVTATSTPSQVEKWDSLNHLKVIVALEEKYGVVFDPEEIALCGEGVPRIIELLKQKGVNIA
jgi:acyl carrier protein